MPQNNDTSMAEVIKKCELCVSGTTESKVSRHSTKCCYNQHHHHRNHHFLNSAVIFIYTNNTKIINVITVLELLAII